MGVFMDIENKTVIPIGAKAKIENGKIIKGDLCMF